MITQIASYGRPSLAQAALLQATAVRAVTPVAAPPVARDRPQSSAAQSAAAQHSASAVAFAPTAMTALIEAQERLAQNAPALVRRHTADEIDHLIARLGATADDELTQAPLTVRQLRSVRDALSRSVIDIKA